MIKTFLQCLLSTLLYTCGNNSHAASKPNIIIIVADDLGYADLSIQGCKDFHTPHIDSIAKNGIRCTSGYVSGPYCSPTRAGLLTGRYQQRFGHEFNPGPPASKDFDPGLSLNETTLPQLLKTAGYKTGMVGKWHLGYSEKFNPVNRGFEEFFGFLGGANTYLQGKNMMRGTKPVSENEYLTDAFAREAVSYVEKHKAEPFFLYLAFNAVHTPLQASPKHEIEIDQIKNLNRRTYANMVYAMDDAVGQLLAKLEKEKISENTLLFFISDNGGPEGVNFSDNGELRGQKATTWEGGVRVPFFVQWKSTLPQGKTYDNPVIQLDILPTILAASGGTFTHSKKLDGVNLLPYLKGENREQPHTELFWRFGAQMAIRMGDWKLTKAPGDNIRFNRSDLASVNDAQLYNLKSDIGESKNVASENPEKVKELAKAWQTWNSQLEKPTWGQVNQKAKKKNP